MILANYIAKPKLKLSGHMLTMMLATIFLLFIANPVFAKSGQDLSGLATTLVKQVQSVAKLLTVIAYVAGIGFSLAGIVQFKAHKDNPQQVPLSKPIVYLSVGACLLFLPTVMRTAGETVFGGGQETGFSFSGDIGGGS